MALVSHRNRVFCLISKLVLRAVNPWEVARTFLDWFHRKSRRGRRPGFEIRESCPDPRSANQAQRVLRNAVMDENDRVGQFNKLKISKISYFTNSNDGI